MSPALFATAIVSLLVFSTQSLCAEVNSPDLLKPYIQAHGGMDLWVAKGVAEYDLVGWPFGKRPVASDHHLVDLKAPRALVTSPNYRLGSDGKMAWITPSLEAVGEPVRTYLFQPFRFFSLPYQFGEANASVHDLGERFLGRQVFDAFRITVGTSAARPEPVQFVAYFSTGSATLHLAHFATGDAMGSRRAIVYDEWQDLDDLIVPAKATFYEWESNRLGAALGSFEYRNVRLEFDHPMPEIFAKPGGAVVDSR